MSLSINKITASVESPVLAGTHHAGGERQISITPRRVGCLFTACAHFNSFLIPFYFFLWDFLAFLVNIFSSSFCHYLNNYNSVFLLFLSHIT